MNHSPIVDSLSRWKVSSSALNRYDHCHVTMMYDESAPFKFPRSFPQLVTLKEIMDNMRRYYVNNKSLKEVQIRLLDGGVMYSDLISTLSPRESTR